MLFMVIATVTVTILITEVQYYYFAFLPYLMFSFHFFMIGFEIFYTISPGGQRTDHDNNDDQVN